MAAHIVTPTTVVNVPDPTNRLVCVWQTPRGVK
jgi:hypothetical protein